VSSKFSACSYIASEKIAHRQAAKVESITTPELHADSADPYKARSDLQGQARGVPRFPKDLDHEKKREGVAWSEVERRSAPVHIWARTCARDVLVSPNALLDSSSSTCSHHRSAHRGLGAPSVVTFKILQRVRSVSDLDWERLSRRTLPHFCEECHAFQPRIDSAVTLQRALLGVAHSAIWSPAKDGTLYRESQICLSSQSGLHEVFPLGRAIPGGKVLHRGTFSSRGTFS
jgi:hypothetical protein